jgi:hypothetical protein
MTAPYDHGTTTIALFHTYEILSSNYVYHFNIRRGAIIMIIITSESLNPLEICTVFAKISITELSFRHGAGYRRLLHSDDFDRTRQTSHTVIQKGRTPYAEKEKSRQEEEKESAEEKICGKEKTRQEKGGKKEGCEKESGQKESGKEKTGSNARTR